MKKHDNFIKAKLYYFAPFFETADICSIPSNINNIWKTVKAQRSNDVSDKDNNRRYNSINVRNKYQPIFTQENEVTEPRINNRMDKDVNKYKNVFNNNIDINVIQKKI